MKKNLLSVTLIIALVLTMVMVFNSDVFADDNTVSQKDAQSTALYNINRFSQKLLPQWKGAGVNSAISYYSIDNTPAAYEFTVTQNNKAVGYIFISARKDWMPVLEFGSGKSPSANLSNAQTTAANKGFISQKDQLVKIFYYGGALDHSVQIGDKMKNDRFVIDLGDGSVRQLAKEMKSLKMDAMKAKSAWAKTLQDFNNQSQSKASNSQTMATELEENNSISVTPFIQSYWGDTAYGNAYQDPESGLYCDSHNYPFYGTTYTNLSDSYDTSASYIGINSDPWSNWDGCVPISSAMIFNYWKGNGYPNIGTKLVGGSRVAEASSDELDEVLIDRAHLAMQTSADDGGTPPENIYQGLIDLSSYYTYYFFNNSNYEPSWSEITDEIDAGSPFMFSIWGCSEFSYAHAVCAKGYYSDDYPEYFIIDNDTLDTSDNYISWGDWTDSMKTDVVPKVRLSMTANGSGTTNPSVAELHTYDKGDIPDISATPSSGWSFAGWSGDLTGNTTPTTLTMDTNKTVTANFTQNNYTVGAHAL